MKLLLFAFFLFFNFLAMEFFYNCVACSTIFFSEQECVDHMATNHEAAKITATPFIRVVCQECGRHYNEKRSYTGWKYGWQQHLVFHDRI